MACIPSKAAEQCGGGIADPGVSPPADLWYTCVSKIILHDSISWSRTAGQRRRRAANRRAVLGWRRRFRALFDEIAALHPPRQPVDLDDLADLVNVTVEGAMVLSRAVADPRLIGRQVMLLRQYLKLLFSPR
jgi:hypothetical protein